ncbi:MAG: hypothetical protein GBAus27B_000537 [Mycoplasmataceae bacterium]|nr:MAG: hypothetical protein GBAus27B_000537 [Mycoplasmataceae bacterium]
MTKKLTNKGKNTVRQEYVSISTKFFPEKSLIVWKMFHCSECDKENIISLNLDAKMLKKLIDKKENCQ